MPLQHRTIQKLLREGFGSGEPMVISPAERKSVVGEIKARLARLQGVDTKDYAYIREEEKGKLICPIVFADSRQGYYHGSNSFRLILDMANRLTIEVARYPRGSALVSSLDEVEEFVRACLDRLARQKAQQVKRAKVRELFTQAILAHVRALARAEGFEFVSESWPHKLRLYVKLSEAEAAALDIPFKDFKRSLPHLRAAIVALRKLIQSGTRFYAFSARGLKWRSS